MKQMSHEAPQRQLRAKMAELRSQQRDHGALKIASSGDPFDQIQASAERDVLVGLLNREAQLRDDLRRACDLVVSGSYGVCEDCEENIAPVRLRAIPWARYCLRCQDLRDREVNESDIFPEAA